MLRIGMGLLSIILIGLLFGSAGRAIDKIQEARIAETAREMVVTNDWVVPHYNGELRLQKPPLTYWTTALSYKLFGVSEAAARVPSVIFALLSACLMFIWLKDTLDRQAAANAVLVMCTSFLGMRYFRSAEAEATLLFFISLACFAGFKLFESPNKKTVYLLMLALGLGFLTKGPAGIAIPLMTVIGYAYATKQLQAVKVFINPAGLIIFLVSAFAWYLWILISMPDVAQQFVSRQVDETFLSGTHQQPIYWYLVHAVEFFAPWSLLLIPMGIWLYQHRPLPKVVHFSIIWLLVVFVLLTFTVNKQTQYALLFLPPIAILVGYYLQEAQGKFYQFNRIIFWLLAIVVIALFVVGIRKQGLTQLSSLPTVFIWPLLLIGPWLLKRKLNIPAPQTPVLFAAVFATFIYLFAEQYITKDTEKDDIKQLVQSVVKNSTSFQTLYQAKPGDGAVSFYANKPIQPLDEKQLVQLLIVNKTLWLLSKDKPIVQEAIVTQEKQIGRWGLWKIASK